MRLRGLLFPVYASALGSVGAYLEAGRPALSRADRPTEALFLSTRGNPMSADALRTRFERRVAEAGLDPSLTPHAMRHTFAYLAGVYSVPQPIVQSVLGHMSPEMTALYQKHASREAKVKFMQQMPNVLGAPAAPLKQLPAPGFTL